ncbi:MAG TPA: SLBB domain-containing protein, partial [Candidatus Eremiobacteraceae bacterium]|nr:SLBB domain-containing protein [Candidatus Eremiobacteraceae bacterium]
MSSAKLVPWKYIAIALASLALAFLVSRFAVPHPSATSGDAPGAVPARLLSGPADPTDAPSAAAEQVVYVCGAVRKPGVYQLRPGARVADALARAGGATTQAEVEQLNLAELLADGMKIVVPRKGQAAIASPIEAESPTAIVAGAATRRPHRTHGAG